MKVRQSILTIAFVLAISLLGYSPSASQTCRWAGTAPYCAGECGLGETEEARATEGGSVQHLPSENFFGNTCVFGTKAYCCKTPGVTCRWDGTAPFCDGGCEEGENEVKRCASCSGKLCWTGSKAKCCRATGSTGQPLLAKVGDARYAAIWEKKSGPAWVARHRMTFAKFQEKFNELGEKGYRLVHVSGYGVGSTDYYAAIWEKKSGPAWVARRAIPESW